MKIISLNIGKIREIDRDGKLITTGIFKSPVSDKLKVGYSGIEGDEIADLTVHGGTQKAVYAYPAEHYPYWNLDLDREDLNYGMFGENLTIFGFLEDMVYLGDVFRAGTAELQVTIPRQPCSKLNAKFGDNQMVKKFLASGRSGFYFKVLKEGVVGVGDEFGKIRPAEDQFSIAAFNLLYATDKNNIELLQKASEAQYLPDKYKQHFTKRLNSLISG